MLDWVTKALGDVPYMRERQALVLRELMREHGLSEVLEIGFFHGRSSVYFAAILEEMGRGHLTTIDKANARGRSPNIDELLGRVELAHRVTPVFAERSYTWELGRMIRRDPRPSFDLCYFDGGHTWDPTGFGFFLVDMLLRPGGWIVFDDLDWTVEASIAKDPERRGKAYEQFDEEERRTPAVRMVFETLVPHLGYEERREARGWGFARKPL